jgi:hypothetical protein
MRIRIAVVAYLLVVSAQSARAEIQKSGPENFPGKNELSAHIGYQAGFSGQFANPSGFKLFFDYGRRFTDLVWLDLQLNPIFGYSASANVCYDNRGRPFTCGANGGWGIEFAAGVKLKIKTKIPLVVEVPLTVGVVGMFSRQCGDNGAALVLRPGAGAKYFLTRAVAVGAGVNFAMGPGFHGASSCTGSYTDFYAAFDFQLGAEFIL